MPSSTHRSAGSFLIAGLLALAAFAALFVAFGPTTPGVLGGAATLGGIVFALYAHW